MYADLVLIKNTFLNEVSILTKIKDCVKKGVL